MCISHSEHVNRSGSPGSSCSAPWAIPELCAITDVDPDVCGSTLEMPLLRGGSIISLAAVVRVTCDLPFFALFTLLHVLWKMKVYRCGIIFIPRLWFEYHFYCNWGTLKAGTFALRIHCVHTERKRD